MSTSRQTIAQIMRSVAIAEVAARHHRLVRESVTWTAMLARRGIHFTETPMTKPLDQRADSVRARLETKMQQYLTMGDCCAIREAREHSLSWLEIGTEARRRGVYLPGQAWPDTHSDNLIAGLALCKVAAVKLGEDPSKEPWNCP